MDLLLVGRVGLRALAPKLRPLTSTLGREVNSHVLTRRTLEAKARELIAFATDLRKDVIPTARSFQTSRFHR